MPALLATAEGDTPHRETLAAVLHEIDAIFVNLSATGPATGELLSMAAGHGSPRVVLLSGLAAETGFEDPLTRHFLDGEKAVQASGLPWTFLRCGEFSANT